MKNNESIINIKKCIQIFNIVNEKLIKFIKI